jgi:hypothetical protein
MNTVTQLLLHACNFTLQSTCVTSAKVQFGGARNAIAVGGGLFNTAPHQIENLIELAFDNCSHRVQFIVEPAAIDDIDALSNVRADAFAFAERRDRHFQEDHRTLAHKKRSWAGRLRGLLLAREQAPSRTTQALLSRHARRIEVDSIEHYRARRLRARASAAFVPALVSLVAFPLSAIVNIR